MPQGLYLLCFFLSIEGAPDLAIENVIAYTPFKVAV